MAKWLEETALIRDNTSYSIKPADLVPGLGVTFKTAQMMCRRLHQGMKTPFVPNLYVVLRSYKNPEDINRNLFPHLYED
ncbi:MAG: hypothetical protein P8Z30_15740 [Acidobacteriota bacterium]